MRRARLLLAATALFISAPGFAQAEDDELDPPRNFELPGDEVAGLEGAGDFDLADGDVVGNPLKRLVKNWPEDLVIAPIPGFSPQMGWKLALAGGYFLESRDPDSDVPPSVLGGFAMAAENGSTAYGGGANLHLLDDNLRIKAGAGYMDIRYRFYGIGNKAGNSGIGVDVLQNGPMYFASASWRVWNRLYAGLGYLRGDVDTRLRIALPEATTLFDPACRHRRIRVSDRIRQPGSRTISTQRLAGQRACDALPYLGWQ